MYSTERAWGNQDNTIKRRPSADLLLTIDSLQKLENFNSMFGQKVVYQTFVDHFGEETTIDILGNFIPKKIAELQISVLTTQRPSDV